MNLAFRQQFEPFVLDGTKTHSFREGHRWREGMLAHVCTGMRTKNYKLHFVAVITKVETLEIVPPEHDLRCPLCGTGQIHDHAKYSDLIIGGKVLTDEEKDEFAWRDGFRWRTEPCMSCCNWAGCNTEKTCKQFYYPKSAGCFKRMMMFVENLPFHGQLIHWDFANRISAEDYRRVQRWEKAAKG